MFKELLAVLVDGSRSLIHDVFDDLTDEEWTTRVVPGANLLGFNAWHMARTMDWAVQTALRGVPEVVEQRRWRERGTLTTPGIGTGLSLPEADEVARGVRRDDVLAYADAVHEEITGWLRTATEEELQRVPDSRRHESRFSEYRLPGHREEVDDLVGLPGYRYISNPSGTHIRIHYGECLLHKQAMRAAARAHA